MSTTTNAVPYAATPFQYPNGKLVRSYRHTTATADFSIAADQVNFFKMPRNAKILGVRLIPTDLDTHATPTLTLTVNLYDGTTTKTYISAQTGGQTGVVCVPTSSAELAVIGYVTANDNFYFLVTIGTGAATAAAGSIYLEVEYTCDLEYGEGSS